MASETITRGSCLCGKIQYEITGKLDNNNMCWCISCRKVTGSVAMANTWCMKENFKLLQGEDSLKIYFDRSCDSGGCIERGFCTSCGSTMISENREKFPGAYIVPVGSMDIDPSTADWAPKAEYYVKRKVPWIETPDNTTKYTELW
ncbi:Mss4-like protein [Xylaria bambusicola]|uniref:Mss4-like protein n=1 Tax=Xylaria bambusicola TaxID=326684 RepID=UPI002007695C|nr:Mss4-like protein [Xylaria bambusicola]KAI0521625.1 Mss4-like protein [Xylaria bambusicola]